VEKTVYQGQFLKMTTEEIGGHVWERAYLPNGVIVFPVTAQGKFLFIRERRPHERPPVRLKPVTGQMDKGLSHEETAQLELQEEIGFKAGRIEKFWQLDSSGAVNSVAHFFLAKDLTPSKIFNPDGEDSIEEVLELSIDEINDKLFTDEIRWGTSVMGWLRLVGLIERNKINLK
jgi:8-oxo-dGTP pyrophosphatase MutT (NUDIX family)